MTTQQNKIGFAQMPLTTGLWYPGEGVTGTVQYAHGTLNLRPWEPPTGTVVTNLGIWLTTAASAGGGCLLGIYDCDSGGQPGALIEGLASAIDLTSGGGAAKSAALATPVVISRRCFLGYMVTGAPATDPVVASARGSELENIGLAAIANSVAGYKVTGVGNSALPASASAYVVDTNLVAVFAQIG